MSSIRTAMPPVSWPLRSSRPSCDLPGRRPVAVGERGADPHDVVAAQPGQPGDQPAAAAAGLERPVVALDEGQRSAVGRDEQRGRAGRSHGRHLPAPRVDQATRLSSAGRRRSSSRRPPAPRGPRRRCTTTGRGSAATTRPRPVRRAGASPARGSRRTASRAAPRAAAARPPGQRSSSIRISTTLPSGERRRRDPRAGAASRAAARPARAETRARPASAASRPSGVERLTTLTTCRTRHRASTPYPDACHDGSGGRRLRARTSLSDAWAGDLQWSAQLKTAHPEGQRERPDEAPATARSAVLTRSRLVTVPTPARGIASPGQMRKDSAHDLPVPLPPRHPPPP